MRIGELKCQNENYEDKQNELEAKIQDLEAENEQLKDLLGKCVFIHASSQYFVFERRLTDCLRLFCPLPVIGQLELM